MSFRRPLLLLLLVSLALASQPQGASASGFGLRRWFGAEYGFDEVSCANLGSDCPGLSADYNFGGQVDSRPTGLKFEDPDGEDREWLARTGNRLFLAAVPGGGPSWAALGTGGSRLGVAPAGTISFAFQVHTAPQQPVMIFRHDGGTPQKVVALTLLPDMRLAVSASGFAGVTQGPVESGIWHEVTLTYMPGLGSSIKLYVNDLAPIEGTLPLGGPDGHVQFGIVTPTASRFAIGFDDYVESSQPNAPIHGARIDYLMPYGTAGSSGWWKTHYNDGCKNAAKNWQFVAEDQTVQVKDPLPGQPGTCNVSNGSVNTTAPFVADEYYTEGIPSKHKPYASASYRRNLDLRPGPDDDILGVRMSVRGRTDAEGIKTIVGFYDGLAFEDDVLEFEYGPDAGYMAMWGATYVQRPGGSPWNPYVLDAIRLKLDSGPTSGISRAISAFNLDFVWVPD